MKKLNAILVICLFLWPMFGLTTKSAITDTRYYPSDTWRTSTPEAQGLDSTQLAKMFDFVIKNDIHIHSLLLIRNGYLVLEAYFYPNSKGVVHDVASVTKSITSILTGISIDKGFIKSVNQPVLDFFADRKIANLSEYKKNLTIEHLLTMRTGLCRNYARGEQHLDPDHTAVYRKWLLGAEGKAYLFSLRIRNMFQPEVRIVKQADRARYQVFLRRCV